MLTRSFTWQKQRGLYQSLVTPSLTAIQTPGHQVSNCKIVYFTANAGSTWPYFLAFPLRQDIVFSSLNRIFEVSSLREEREFVFLCVVFNRELKQTTMAGSWQKRHQTKVNQQKHWLCTFWIFVHFLPVICKTTTWNGKLLRILENVNCSGKVFASSFGT